MAQRLTFLGRVSSRWRVRIEIPEDLCVQGLTVGLWGEDGRPLAPSVVVPHVGAGVVEAEVGGPAALPAGTEVRCIADVVGADPITVAVGTDRRRGLHAFLHADLRLPVSSNDLVPVTLGRQDKERLARAYPWVVPGRVAVADPTSADDVLSMLRDDFGVDLDDMDEDLLASLKDRDP